MSPSPPRLCAQTLARAHAQRPAYDRAALRPGIVHLGLGAFFRAHGALYTDEVLGSEPGDWGIIGASLQRPDQRDRLQPQDWLYAALERGPGGLKARIVGSLLGVRVATEDPAGLVAAMAAAETRIVTLTITEKGYCHDPATGRLVATHPDIVHDLASPASPRTAVGFLTEALDRRRLLGAAPFTVLCCDNLPANGKLVAGLVQDFAALRDERLAQWVATNVAFPSSMVDRIVPAATPADIAEGAALMGVVDEAPAVHEPFRQWVIEDRFVDGARPRWERGGAELVGDVTPFEHMKLRLLNGAHSALAYLGYLSGYETIVEAVGDPALAGFIGRLWRDEIIPVVPPPPGTDLHDYTRRLMVRFANPAIRHRTWQIAMDGSQKLPQRLLATIRERRARGLDLSCLTLVIAAWIRYVGGLDERGQRIDVRDPLAEKMRNTLDAAGPEPTARVAAALGVEAVFGSDLGQDATFVEAVTRAYADLLRLGARGAAEALGN